MIINLICFTFCMLMKNAVLFFSRIVEVRLETLMLDSIQCMNGVCTLKIFTNSFQLHT